MIQKKPPKKWDGTGPWVDPSASGDAAAEGQPLDRPQICCLSLLRSMGRWRRGVRQLLYYLLTAAPPALSVLLFSNIGFGPEVYDFLQGRQILAAYGFGAVFVLLTILWAFNVEACAKRACWATFRRDMVIIISALSSFSALFLVDILPWVPLAIFIVTMPAYFMLIFMVEREVIETIEEATTERLEEADNAPAFDADAAFEKEFSDRSMIDQVLIFINRIRVPQFLLGIATLVSWICINPPKIASKEELVSAGEWRGLCSANATLGDANALTGESECLYAFLLWCAPLLVGGTLIEISFLSSLLRSNISSSRGAFKELMAKGDIHSTEAAKLVLCQSCLQFGFLCLLTALIAMYLTTALASINMMLSYFTNSVVFFMLFSLLVLIEVLSVTVGDIHLDKLPLWQKFRNSWAYIWFLGLGTLLFSPFILLFMFLSGIKGVLCKICGGSKKDKMQKLGTNWTEVLLCALWVGIGFVTLQVGIARVTTLFLSWFNNLIASWDLAVIIALFFAVGILLFMNPLIPGIPVYLSGGIVLTSAMKQSHGFFPAFGISTLVCFILKLVAVALQQKGIGAQLGHRAEIRQLVGVNTVMIRAIKRILSRPGFHLSKVAILCGGPDWPTSVLTGILGLPLCDMLVGSMPVYMIIAPTCASSAMMLVGKDHVLADFSVYIVAFGGFCQVAGSMLAVFFISQCIETNREELMEDIKRNPDLAVLELDKLAAARLIKKNALVAWSTGKLPFCIRFMLVFAVILMSCSCYIFFMFPTRCFKDFELTDSIDAKLGGSALNLVKPLGWVGTGLFIAPCILLKIYYRYVRSLMKAEESATLAKSRGEKMVI